MVWLLRMAGPRRSAPVPVYVILLGCVVTLQFLIVTRNTCETNRCQVSEDVKYTNPATGKMFQRNFSSTQTSALTWRPTREEALVFPSPARNKVTLTIGIPTVRRQGDSYILKTLNSLIHCMTPDDQRDVVIVVLLADLDPVPRRELAAEIHDHFSAEIESGVINVIQAPAAYYPELKITKHTYGQDDQYIRWRAKQNFDSSFLFKYSLDLSTYYMALEDDVTTLPGFLGDVKSYVAEQKDAWICLEFSELGFIGKLFRNENLPQLAVLFELFYLEQPVDYTYLYFNKIMMQMEQKLRKPTLFQHQGLKSSFPGKIQPLKDQFFDNMKKKYKGDNPQAEVMTSMKTFNTYTPNLAYARVEGYFWSRGSPKAGDTYTVVFTEPQRLSRIVVETGSFGHPSDKLVDARLDMSLTSLKFGHRVECTNNIPLGEFKDGRIDVGQLSEKIVFKAMCVQVTVTKPHRNWVIVREVAVFVNKNVTRT